METMGCHGLSARAQNCFNCGGDNRTENPHMEGYAACQPSVKGIQWCRFLYQYYLIKISQGRFLNERHLMWITTKNHAFSQK